jgi:signal transduction histidine kinase
MQERAALVGASLEIESTPGKGTTILVRIAVPARAGEVVDHA